MGRSDCRFDDHDKMAGERGYFDLGPHAAPAWAVAAVVSRPRSLAPHVQHLYANSCSPVITKSVAGVKSSMNHVVRKPC